MFHLNDKSILAPIDGKCIPLSEVKDEVFAKEMIGPGYAILPTDGNAISPVKGKVSVIAKTKHCIGITCDDGLEIMIHFGIDSFKTEGKGFEYCVNVGDSISKGQEICKLDLEYFKEQNIDITTPIVILNSDKFKIFESKFINKDITKNDVLMKYKQY